MADGNGSAARWQDELYDLLRRHNITQFAYVPDAGHRILIDRSLADPGARSVALTTEEEGVALLAGADLGGERGVLLMQSSGTGNCINMLSLIKGGHLTFLTLVSMRGDFGEGNPWQYPMGQAVEPVLKAMGVICLRVEEPEEVVPTVSAALTMVFQGGNAVAVLKLIGRHEDFLFVTGLAGTARDIAALTGDGAHIYTMAGAMGGACMLGLGLALARPDKRVLVATGDGELLMNIGALATIAVLNPPNLAILCVDNGHYGETGYQKSHTSLGVDLEKIAAGSGIKRARTIAGEAELAAGGRMLREGNGTAF